MPFATTDDGVRLHYEETGAGTPVIFVHEYAGDHRSWEPQMRHFGRRYRAVAFNARGYPPSDVPEAVSAYAQARAAIAVAADDTAVDAHVDAVWIAGFPQSGHPARDLRYVERIPLGA